MEEVMSCSRVFFSVYFSYMSVYDHEFIHYYYTKETIFKSLVIKIVKRQRTLLKWLVVDPHRRWYLVRGPITHTRINL